MRFGEENDPETEGIPDEIVRDSVDLGETLDNDLHHDADPGVDEIERGYGSVSLTECLGRLRVQNHLCYLPLWEGWRDTRSFPTDPSHLAQSWWVFRSNVARFVFQDLHVFARISLGE